MIQAIRNNKTKTELKEDTQTSSFFGLLFYLPDEIIIHFFEKLIKKENIGNFQEFEFWSHWSSKGTTNKKFIEPDLFVRFDNIDIVIEVKKKETFQYFGQWDNEITAYKNMYGDKKDFILLAIGGKSDINTNKFNNIYRSWFETVQIIKKIISENSEIKNTKNFILILEDILYFSSLHGILVKEITWFESFNPKTINLKNTSILTEWINFKKFPKFNTNYSINFNSSKTLKEWQIKKI